jgi:hypothetical protein
LKYPWFQTCGQPLQGDVTTVSNWKDAVKESSSRKWNNSCLMARNALDFKVQTQSWERGQEWNPLAEELRPIIVSFVEQLLPKTPVPTKLAPKVKATLSWDIMFLCFEYHYQDIVQPVFYIPYLEPWYSKGHFPCGWDGEEFPEHWDGIIRDGRLMVF